MIFNARYRDEEIPLEVERHGSAFRVRIGERWIVADLITAGGLRSLRLEDGTQFLLAHHREGTTHQITIGASRLDIEIVDPLALRRKRGDDHLGDSGIIKALMPGRISRVLVEKGAEVQRGTGLLVLEAMKMENEIPAPADGVIDEIFVKAGDTVEGGADLLHLRPVKSEG
ncbi:MAG: 3-methylcrotonyl-CoA carboxylase alpha subunit [Thermoanaerobaculia bacterium]|nr:3-methylcrotonyl-CoA carboxylase alpha subunit [Thermoanaerobaculia bacterium]